MGDLKAAHRTAGRHVVGASAGVIYTTKYSGESNAVSKIVNIYIYTYIYIYRHIHTYIYIYRYIYIYCYI